MSPKLFEEPLYFAGLNIDKERAYYGIRRGLLTRLLNGVYLNADITPEDRREVILKNSARIALRSQANSILAGSAAFHRGAIEGHMLLATPSGGKPVDVGGVFTIHLMRTQIDVGMNREVEPITIEDDFGAMVVKRMADEMLIIKNFQKLKGRPTPAYLNVKDLVAVVERSIETLGSKEKLDSRLHSLMRTHGLLGLRSQIEEFIGSVVAYKDAPRNLKSFEIFWHATPVATLSHDGHIWSFDYRPNVDLQLSVSERRGKRAPPSFLGSILPETGKGSSSILEDKFSGFQLGSRYMSNITVHPSGAKHQGVIIDMLGGELSKFSTEKLEFSGRVNPSLAETAANEALICEMQENPQNPRLSGMQVKLPAYLDKDGELSAAIDKPFTHMLKVAGSGEQFQSLGSMEWFSLTVAKMCGLKTEDFGIVELKDRGPALLVERFDVRRDLNDTRLILTEDFWSIAGMLKDDQKYQGELMDVADALLKHSTDSSADGRNLIAQAMFSWLTWNGDFHLKNLMLLKESKDPRKGFDSIRLSPIYDMLCSQVYPGDPKSAAIALGLNRVHTLSGFRALGKKFGIPTSDVDAMADFLSSAIPLWASRVSANLPAAIKNHQISINHIERAKSLFDIRCMMMLSEVEAAKGSRGQALDVAPADDVGSFSGEGLNEVASHMDAQLRRSWTPVIPAETPSEPPKGADAKPASKNKP